ncbi:MAG: tetratricopeptide repeat protein [candidate division NC10 bacterium]|nr:tetratricopeptide repeat protein [candidate division NC10 bacterium]
MKRKIVVSVVLLSLAAAVAGAEPLSRAQALVALQDRADVAARRQGAAWLGDTGLMPDVPLLVEALRDPDELVRALAEHSLWQVWGRSGHPEADRQFQIGVEQMNQGDLGAAIETFGRIIQGNPDFAEAWNKRATAYYLLGEFGKSLADCEEVLRRNPVHFGALSGFGLIYLQLREPERAIHYFRRALAVNPNLAQIKTAVEELERLLRERSQESI